MTHAVRKEHTEHLGGIEDAHLQHDAELFGEQRRERIFFVLSRVLALEADVDLDAAVTGKGHLDQRDGETAVGSIVIGKHFVALPQHRKRGGHAFQQRWVIDIGRFRAERAIDLSQYRAA